MPVKDRKTPKRYHARVIAVRTPTPLAKRPFMAWGLGVPVRAGNSIRDRSVEMLNQRPGVTG